MFSYLEDTRSLIKGLCSALRGIPIHHRTSVRRQLRRKRSDSQETRGVMRFVWIEITMHTSGSTYVPYLTFGAKIVYIRSLDLA